MMKSQPNIPIQKKCKTCTSDLEALEATFRPCYSCEVQLCSKCLDDIVETEKLACPGCKTRCNIGWIRNRGNRRTKPQPMPGETSETILKKHFKGVSDPSKLRVLDRKVVGIRGLAPKLASNEVLGRSLEQYGKILRIKIEEKPRENYKQLLCYGAYVTFSSEVEALTAIIALDQIYREGRMLSACFGTKQYCRHFLEALTCGSDCNYVHYRAGPDQEINDKSNNPYDFRQYTDLNEVEKVLHELEKKLSGPKTNTKTYFTPLSGLKEFIMTEILSDRGEPQQQKKLEFRDEPKKVNIIREEHARERDSLRSNESYDSAFSKSTREELPNQDISKLLFISHPDESNLSQTAHQVNPNGHCASNDPANLKKKRNRKRVLELETEHFIVKMPISELSDSQSDLPFEAQRIDVDATGSFDEGFNEGVKAGLKLAFAYLSHQRKAI